MEDFEATLGTDRRGGRAEAYSRVRASGSPELARGALGVLAPAGEEGTVGGGAGPGSRLHGAHGLAQNFVKSFVSSFVI